MIRFKNFENYNGERKSLSTDMMIVQYVNAARKAHLLRRIKDFRGAWRPPDNTINFLRWSSKQHYIGKWPFYVFHLIKNGSSKKLSNGFSTLTF